MSYKKCIAIIVLIFGNLLVHGQSQNHVNNEINNFVHETIDIQSPVFEALEMKFMMNSLIIFTKYTLQKLTFRKQHIYNDIQKISC